MNIKLDTTKKDLFKIKLQGERLDFGEIADQDYPKLIEAGIRLGLLSFYHQKEYQGVLAFVRVNEDFGFAIHDRYAGSTKGWTQQVNVWSGDFIEFSEIIMTDRYSFDFLASSTDGPKKHYLYVDFDFPHQRSELRTREYRRYDFGV